MFLLKVLNSSVFKSSEKKNYCQLMQLLQARYLAALETFILISNSGTGISSKEKNRKGNFQMCLSLIFHNYKIVFFKSEPLLLLKLN